MGDTDGLQFYNNYYLEKYNDCNIIVPHLGAFHDKEKKKPNGYKHLYREGIERFLTALDDRDRCIILGEFGFELATKPGYIEAFSNFIPATLNYSELIKRIHRFLLDQSNSRSEENSDLQFLGRLYGSMFVSQITKLEFYTINLEIFLAIIQCKEDLVNEMISNYQNLTAEEIIEIYRRLFSFLYQNEEIGTFTEYIQDKFENSQLNDLRTHLTSFFQRFLAHLTREDRYQLRSTILKYLYSFELNDSRINQRYLDRIIRIDAVQEYFLHTRQNKTFPGISNEIKTQFSNFERKGIILLCFCQFLILLYLNESFSEESDETDGREIICHYLSQKFKIPIIPTHPSYKIIFTQEKLKIEGRTAKCWEINISSLNELNPNWRILKRGAEELIDIIQGKYCAPCEMERELQRHEAEIDEERYAEYEVTHSIEVSEEIDEINELIETTVRIHDIFARLNNIIFPETLHNIDSELLLNKINALLETSEDPFTDLMLVHPNLLFFSNVKEVVITRLRGKSESELHEIFVDIIADDSPIIDLLYDNYKDEIFDNADLVEVFHEIIAKLNISELLDSIKYMKRIKERHRSTRNHPFVQSFKRRFIQVFYQLLIAPQDNLERLRILRNRTDVLDIFQQLGYPFNLYLNK